MNNKAISSDLLFSARKQKLSSQRNALKNAVISSGITAVARNNDVKHRLQQTFSHEIKTGKITSQKKSGRCWIFAGLNLIRQDIAKQIKVEDFELSAVYLEFYDLFEKANWFLEKIIELRAQPFTDRKIELLLIEPSFDGGHWNFFSNLVEKYGVVPKDAMPETFHSENTREMNKLLALQLRQYAYELRSLHEKKRKVSFLRKKKQGFLKEYYVLLQHFLGKPPAKFDFEYTDKDDVFHQDKNITPQKFLQQYCSFDLADFVPLTSIQAKPSYKTYTIDFLNTVEGAKPVHFLNIDKKELKQLAIMQLKDNIPIWFGADALFSTHRKEGIFAPEFLDVDTVLGLNISLKQPELYNYRAVQLNHAMLCTGVHLKGNNSIRWKVENSWGDEVGEKGYFVMSDKWVNMCLHEMLIHKKFLSDKIKKALQKKPEILPPWDPFALAVQVKYNGL